MDGGYYMLDDGYIYQEFFSGEDSGGDGCFSRGGCLGGGGCSTIFFMLVILILLLLLPIVTIFLTYLAITSPETFFEDVPKGIFLLAGLYSLIIGITIFIIYQYHKNKKK